MFTLAISCLTTSNLPWFMDLTFLIPMQYCSLQHWTLLSLPDASTAEQHFCFGPASWFFLEFLVIALHFYPVAYWTPSNLEGSSSGVIPFCPSYCSWGSCGKNIGVVCHFLLQWTTFVRTLHYDLSVLGSPAGLAHSFIELCKPLSYDKAVIHEGGCLLFFLNKHLLLERFYIFRRWYREFPHNFPLLGKPHMTIIHLSKLREKLIIN